MGAGSSVLSPQVPRSREEVAELLESASWEGRRVRVVGGGTKLGFGRIGEPPDVELSNPRPLPPATATAVGEGGDGGEVAAAASEIAHSPLEYRCLDLRLEDGRASALVRFGGAAAREGAESAERLLRRRGLRTEVVDEDD